MVGDGDRETAHRAPFADPAAENSQWPRSLGWYWRRCDSSTAAKLVTSSNKNLLIEGRFKNPTRLAAAAFKGQNQVFRENIPNGLCKVSTDVWLGAKKTGFQTFETCWVYRWKWSEATQSRPTLCDPMDWTVARQAPPSMGFSRQEYWSGFHFLLQGIFPTQGSNLGLPYCRQTLYRLSHQETWLQVDWD